MLKYDGEEVVLVNAPDPGFCFGCVIYHPGYGCDFGMQNPYEPFCGNQIYKWREDVPNISE